MKKTFITSFILLLATQFIMAQKVTTFTTTEAYSWVKGKTTLSTKAESQVVAEVNAQSQGTKFHGFGTTFNELDWDAFKSTNGQYIITAGNFTDKPAKLSVKIGKKYLNIQAKPHSFNTYVI